MLLNASEVIAVAIAFMLAMVVASTAAVGGSLSGTTSGLAPPASHPASASVRPRWMDCILRVHDYFVPLNNSHFRWKEPNPCNFTALTDNDIRDQLLYDSSIPASMTAANESSTNQPGASQFAFAGDSTAFRAWIYSVNRYLVPDVPIVVRRIAESPVFQESRKRNGSWEAALQFYRLQYVSAGSSVIKKALQAPPNGTASKWNLKLLLLNGIGNWDMNWKMQLKSPMPGLVGGVHNFTAATIYWTTFVEAMVEELRESLLRLPVHQRPIVIVREQARPNCGASRFVNPKRKYRQCAPFLRPVLVPLYRRTLAPLLWSIGVPVVPIDPLFAGGTCSMSDGIHLDCHHLEMQLIWNVYRLLKTQKIAPGEWLSSSPAIAPLPPHSAWFVNEENYSLWHRQFFGDDLREVLPSLGAIAGVSPLPKPTPFLPSGLQSAVGATTWEWTVALAIAVFVLFSVVTFLFVR